jgi:Protein of unknown function (DUF3301)
LDTAGLILLISLGVLLWFWFNTLTVRDLAVDAVRTTCRNQNLQLLDGTVALQRFSVTRSPRGHMTLRRTFLFAYSTDGVERQTGFVITLGNRIEQVGL